MSGSSKLVLTITHSCEEDGRYIAEIPELPGILPVYGATKDEAARAVVALALYWVADRMEEGDFLTPDTLEFRAA